MSISYTLVMERIANATSPLVIRDIILSLGYTGLVFQRWHTDYIENWEGQMPPGFLEVYYGDELDRECPVARSIHNSTRSFTFTEARRDPDRSLAPEIARRIERVFESFGLYDGAVIMTGRNNLQSCVILFADKPCTEEFAQTEGLLHFAAHKLTGSLPPMHPLLSRVPRTPPNLSTLQTKIIRMQIDNPEMSTTEMARALDMSPKTLQAHHKKIAKKTGVTTFAGAVLKHFQTHR